MKTDNAALFVSVVVISKDRHELLLKSVAALRELNYPAGEHELIVVEEGDAPQPMEGVKYIFLPRRNLGLGYARNRGLQEAKGEIVALTDDDTRVDAEWLREITAPFSDREVYGTAGLTRAQESNLLGETEEIIGVPGGGIGWLLKSSDKPVETKFLSGCNCAYRRAVLEKFRFKEDTFGRIGGEDWYMAEQVCSAYKCMYNPRAVVHHKPRADVSRLIHTFYRRELCGYLAARELYKRSKLQYMLEKGAGLVIGRIIFVFLIALLAGPVYLVPLSGFYYLAVLFKYYRLFPYVRRKTAFFLVPVTNLIIQAGILKAELEIIFSGETRYDHVLGKF